MAGERAARFIGILAATMFLVGCFFSPPPNPDGWLDSGVHAVDGYWVTEERPCSPETDLDCAEAMRAAIAILHATEPGAVVTAAVSAGYPTQRAPGADEIDFAFAGLQQPRLMILDLADGTRRTIALNCGPETVDGVYPVHVCHGAAEFDLWRVTGS